MAAHVKSQGIAPLIRNGLCHDHNDHYGTLTMFLWFITQVI
jgi:hypothetical protein